MRRRSRGHRLALTLLIAAVLTLLLAAPALAAAGGGSAGFGGGGGGGGGGRGAGLYILFQILIRIAILGHGLGAVVLIALVLIWLLFTRVTPQARSAFTERRRSGRSARRQVAKRERRVELAAAEAAEDDPAFAPDAVRPAAAQLFEQIQRTWSADDRVALTRLVGPKLLTEWERRLDDFRRRGWTNHVEVVGDPKVEYVGLARRSEHGGDDRVIVRIEASLRDYVVDIHGNRIKRAGRLTQTVKVREFWTLTRRRGGWILTSIEQGAEGSHVLADEIVATPWSDEQALRDEALMEGAAADAVPSGTKLAELASVSFEGDARAAALDLSLVDGRFAPDVLEVSARRAVAAWADAIDGNAAALRALATPMVVAELLHPGDPSATSRVVVRGLSVDGISVAGLEARAAPPRMTIEVALTGRRYIEDRATAALVAGSQTRETHFRERWTFALDGDDAQPWRIVAVAAPSSSP